VQARLGQLGSRLTKLSQIDVAQISVDAVGLGSKVVVVDQDTRDEETYHFVFGDALELEDNHVTMASPIGRAMLGKKKGEVVLLKLPARTRTLKIVELVTIHEASPDDLA
jgi:transcription elongation factor GreA